MSNPVDIVHAFWNECWNAHDPARWLSTGKNNGFAGTTPDRQEIKMMGTAIWAVWEDAKLLSNHVERATREQLQRLTPT